LQQICKKTLYVVVFILGLTNRDFPYCQAYDQQPLYHGLYLEDFSICTVILEERHQKAIVQGTSLWPGSNPRFPILKYIKFELQIH
jgi:hypothetical protein